MHLCTDTIYSNTLTFDIFNVLDKSQTFFLISVFKSIIVHKQFIGSVTILTCKLDSSYSIVFAQIILPVELISGKCFTQTGFKFRRIRPIRHRFVDYIPCFYIIFTCTKHSCNPCIERLIDDYSLFLSCFFNCTTGWFFVEELYFYIIEIITCSILTKVESNCITTCLIA
ncbi:hypothetical protein SDC9_138938 [bioreactor metagenome]|uniref:Uncharacterized protein n=1 Tax=bioreactor metagenome TaxID=1076179 RepID=A0A645DQQ9_9ZZZZ